MTSLETGPKVFDLPTVASVLGVGLGRCEQAAVTLGYAALLPGMRASTEALGTCVDNTVDDCLAGRRTLCFDRLARPVGFARAALAMGQACSLTRKKDVLDHAATRLRELIAVGEALLALRAAPTYAQGAVGPMVALAMTLGGMGQYRLYKDRSGAPAGLLSWAWVSAWTMERLRGNPLSPLHPCEWSEGEHLYFRDIAASRACVDELAADLAGRLYPDEPACYVALRKADSGVPELTACSAAQRPAFAEWLRARFVRGGGPPASP